MFVALVILGALVVWVGVGLGVALAFGRVARWNHTDAQPSYLPVAPERARGAGDVPAQAASNRRPPKPAPVVRVPSAGEVAAVGRARRQVR